MFSSVLCSLFLFTVKHGDIYELDKCFGLLIIIFDHGFINYGLFIIGLFGFCSHAPFMCNKRLHLLSCCVEFDDIGDKYFTSNGVVIICILKWTDLNVANYWESPQMLKLMFPVFVRVNVLWKNKYTFFVLLVIVLHLLER